MENNRTNELEQINNQLIEISEQLSEICKTSQIIEDYLEYIQRVNNKYINYIQKNNSNTNN